MKTTIELPDDLMREVKIRAVHENRKLKDLVAELLRRGLEQPSEPRQPIRHRAKFPLIEGTHPAPPGEEATPERIAEVLLEQEVERFADASRR